VRHLPYFQEGKHRTRLDYSKLLDYTNPKEHDTAKDSDNKFFDVNDNLKSSNGDTVDPAEVIVIAGCYESGGHYFALDTLHDEITIYVVCYFLLRPEDVKTLFDELEEQYRLLLLIPCPNRDTIHAIRVDERVEPIEQSEVMAQTEKWGTDLDWQFVRQIYRQHGWPDAFRRDEAIKAVEEFMTLKFEERGDWEEPFK